MTIMITVILMIILFVFLIFPHELGHFMAAKACGVQVNEFAFGMGPAIFKKQGPETLYSIRAIPIGGYCAMEGEDKEESPDNPRAFNNKAWWQKIIILLAGAAMNILVAIIALSILFGVRGMPTTTVDKVTDDGPAKVAEIQAGDKITAVDGKHIESYEQLIKAFQTDKTIELTVERDGKTLDKEVTPVKDKENDRYLIGIQLDVSHNVFKAAGEGAKATWKLSGALLKALRDLFTSPQGLKQVSGPVGMVSIVNNSVSYGLIYFIYLVAVISLNLAVFNLLPFPALDGGRIIFVIIRLITGKAITDATEAKVHAVGMMMLIALMIFATWNDIVRLIK